jgi:hypothetical protein
MVAGEGAKLNNSEQLKNWSRKKTITQRAMLALIDIADSLGNERMKKSYWNAYYCLHKVTTSGNSLYGKYCKTRFCPVCLGIRKADFINRYMPEISTWEDPRMLTVTVKSAYGCNLRKLMDEMYEVFNRINDRYKARYKRGKKFKLKGLRSLECNFNSKALTYNPHFHILLPSHSMAKILRAEWIIEGRKKWGVKAIDGKAQNISRRNRVEEDLIEVIKYSSKIFTQRKNSGEEPKIYAAALHQIFCAMQGRRIIDRFGFDSKGKYKTSGKEKRLENYKDWVHHPSSMDWLEVDGALTLSNYRPSENDLTYLKKEIDTNTA